MLLASLAATLLACTGTNADSTSGAPSLTLISPVDGDTVCGGPLEVVTKVENFTLTNQTIENPPPNEGHMHVYLNGQEAAQSDSENVTITDEPNGDGAPVNDGPWQLSLDLALADHSPLVPFVGTYIYITVDNTLCTG